MTGKTVGASSFLETTIGYDLHSWINDISLKKGSNNLFKETLRYSSPSRSGSVSPRYDGTLSETTVQHALSSGVTQSETWGYSYDKLSRLTDALHFNGSSTSSSNINTERDITYDFNGNITALKRYGPSGLANNLTFMLTGNRMSAVSDAVSSSNSGSYNYDSSGNQTQDGRQNLQIQWNIFNLASGAVTPNGSLTFARLSDGDRIFTKQVGTNTPAKRYCGSFLFSVSGNGAVELESVAWDEGRILYNPNQTQPYRDCWMAGDHLGNVRSVVDISPELTSAAILEQSDYTPFGTRLGISSIAGSRWRYAGKEEVRLHPGNVFSSTSGNPDLKLIDFGARLYDPFTARWTARDPMATKYVALGPYNYCAGSPANLVDPDGRDFRKRRHFNTITISADYYVSNKSAFKSASRGVAFWNKRVNDTYVDPNTGVKYSIRYNLSVKYKTPHIRENQYENTFDISDLMVNTLSENDATGVTRLKKEVYVKNAYAFMRPDGNPSSTSAHEIGHTLGMSDSEIGIMSKSQDNNRSAVVTDSNIKEMMSSEAGRETIVDLITRLYDIFKKVF